MKRFAIVILIYLLPVIVAADCAGDSKNLLAKANCNFEKGASGWVEKMGKVSHDPKEGALKGADSEQSLMIQGPCVKVKPGTEYKFGMRLKTAAGSPYFMSLNLFQYTDAECSAGSEPLGSAGMPPSKEWQSPTAVAKTSGEAASIQVQITGSGEPGGFAILFDDIFLNEL